MGKMPAGELAIITGMPIQHLVREARNRAGLTQKALATRTNVPQSATARIETGARASSTAMVERLVRAVGFEIRAELGEPDPENESLFERTLVRTPQERLADARLAARFVRQCGTSRVASARPDREKDCMTLPRLRQLLERLQHR